MNTVVAAYKPPGHTPLSCLTQLREEYPEFRHEKLSYAGRLDPLAHGVLLILVGDACKDARKYLNLDKTYIFKLVLGIATDTYDTLGIVQTKRVQSRRLENTTVNLIVNSFVNDTRGTVTIDYPPYSSRTVQGKPLFWWAKEGKLDQITIPKRNVQITEFSLVKAQQITLGELAKTIEEQNARVQGDFRQETIKKAWKDFFAKMPLNNKLRTMTFTLSCSSGTYVRSLAHMLGEKLGSGTLALDIERTRVGTYTSTDALKLFSEEETA